MKLYSQTISSPLNEDDLRAIHHGLIVSQKFDQLVIFDLLCTGFTVDEVSECKIILKSENSEGYLIVRIGEVGTAGKVCHVPIHKLNAEWVSKFKSGDFLFTNPSNPLVRLAAYEISELVRGWTVYLGESKELTVRNFRTFSSRKLITSSPSPYPSIDPAKDF